jgi:hypothetical protein
VTRDHVAAAGRRHASTQAGVASAGTPSRRRNLTLTRKACGAGRTLGGGIIESESSSSDHHDSMMHWQVQGSADSDSESVGLTQAAADGTHDRGCRP